MYAWVGRRTPLRNLWQLRLYGLTDSTSVSERLLICMVKCLSITANTNLFREITGIDQAMRLWERLEKGRERDSRDNVVHMEDVEGNVMPERVYYDLQKQGILQLGWPIVSILLYHILL
ncbi:splicing factor 3a subunit 3 [Penicillium angulare]|uniref:splicing factor 3a subunit 3 n=1 Tax=Penicillium angulare TaxID=116970 RepID=UPI0025405686|nr:splicing factor 3a subunit 3 [Penicillium angulare]KAJ5272394.1 splicing factor 3a subunit 3 [Penicillium angulare]